MAMKILTEMRFSKLYIVGVTVYSEGALTTFFIFNFFCYGITIKSPFGIECPKTKAKYSQMPIKIKETTFKDQ